MKQAIFCRRLVHQTFAPIGSSGEKAVGVIRHEGISGHSAKDVSSAYIKFVENMRDIKKYIFWEDSCAAQNENWWLFTALVREVNRTDGPELTTLKYFEPGHTYKSSDSFHHLKRV